MLAQRPKQLEKKLSLPPTDLKELQKNQQFLRLITRIAMEKDINSICVNKKEFPAITNSNLLAAKSFFLELKSLMMGKPTFKKALEGDFYVELYDYIPGDIWNDEYWRFRKNDTFHDNFVIYQVLRNAPDEFIQFLAEEFPEYTEKALQSIEKFLVKYPDYKNESKKEESRRYPHYEAGFDYSQARLKILDNCSEVLASNMSYSASGVRKKDLIAYYQTEMSKAKNEEEIIQLLARMESSALINAKRLPSFDKFRKKEDKPTQSHSTLFNTGFTMIENFTKKREEKVVVSESVPEIKALLLEEESVEKCISGKLSSGNVQGILKLLEPALNSLQMRAQLKLRYLTPVDDFSVTPAPPGGPDPSGSSDGPIPSAPPAEKEAQGFKAFLRRKP